MLYIPLRAILVSLANRKIASVRGLEHFPNDGSCIIAANHCGWLDPVYLTAASGRRIRQRMSFISATNKYWLTRAVIPIDPKDRSRCLQTAAKRLQEGEVVGIFPVGDPRKNGSGKAHTGVARLARMTGKPIIPAALNNVLPGHTWKSISGIFFQRPNIEICFGNPILFPSGETSSNETLHREAMHVLDAIHSLCTPAPWPSS